MGRIKIKAIETEEGLKLITIEKNEVFNISLNKDNIKVIDINGEMQCNELVIGDGEEVLIGDQFKPWVFTKLSKDRWEANHESFGTKKIFSYKNYLMALTSGSARNGILHNEKVAKNIFDEIMNKYGKYIKMSIHIRSDLDGSYSFGGKWCDHVNLEDKRWSYTYTNGKHKEIILPLSSDSDNIYHRDCHSKFIGENITDATICVSTQQFANPYFMSIVVSATNKEEINKNKHLLIKALEESFDLELIMGVEGFEKFRHAVNDSTF